MYLTNTHQTREAHVAANGPDSSKYQNKTIRVINDHHQIFYSCRKLPPPLKARDWLTRNLFQRVNANTIKYFSTSIHDDDPDIPPGSFTKTTMENIVRGEFRSVSACLVGKFVWLAIYPHSHYPTLLYIRAFFARRPGEIFWIHTYQRLPHNQTSFTLQLKVDFKGSVPKKIANMAISGALQQVYRAYKYFQRDEEIDELEVSLIEMMNIMRGS